MNIDDQIERWKTTIETGHKASDCVRELVAAISDMHCPSAAGFEGPDTFPDCNRCIVCAAVKYTDNEQNPTDVTNAQLLDFAKSCLDPERNGLAVNAFVRDHARFVLGMRMVEAGETK